ncbi:MAG: RluA family pseudouridine synthase [Bacilli bacterium]
MIKFNVKGEEQGQRIDKYLRKKLNNAPLSLLYKLFRKKDIKVNSKRVAGDYLVQENDLIEVYLSPEYLAKYMEEKPVKKLVKSFRVVYEDQHLLIVDKPAGLSIHADEHEATNTLANQVLSYCKDKGDSSVVAPAHRLDRNTSGLVIFGKDMETLHELQDIFKYREGLHKYYLALCFNELKAPLEINAPLLKNESLKLVKVDPNGLPAKTLVKPVLTNSDYSLVEAELLTGRTHQIRVHLAFSGYPIVGDQKYGDFTKNKTFAKEYKMRYQFLHAYKLVFGQLSGVLSYMSNREIVAELPYTKQKIVDKIFHK